MPKPLILFDAGDTVIIESLTETGPMVSWQTIEAVPGIESALQALQPEFDMMIASNADQSTGEMARQALARLNLDGYFSRCFTSIDLGLRKPDPAFFHAILEAAGAVPSASIMVGNSYPIDVLGARAAGLKAIWYNPGRCPAPGGVPWQDAETDDMSRLPGVINSPMLPAIETCIAWLRSEDASDDLLGHVQAVAFAAYHLACRMRLCDHPVDPLLAHRGALLHDLDKATHTARGLKHGEHSASLLEGRGQPALAGIARRHVFSAQNLDADLTLEEKAVFYADKLVEGHRFVGLAERVERLAIRYPQYAPGMRQNLPRVAALEAELCNLAGVSPSALYAELQAAWPAQFPGWQ